VIDRMMGRGNGSILIKASDLGINEMSKQAYATACEKGFRDAGVAESRGILGDLMLIVTEVAEAAEEVRNPEFSATRTYYRKKDRKPEGLPAELADIIIRIGDLAGSLGIDLSAAVVEKMKFNKTRPRLHGKTC